MVSHRSTSLKPISKKHIKDIWELADNVASNNHVKRTLLKSGKRNQTYLTKKWDRSAADHLGHISLFNINADDQINCSSHTCSSVGDSQLVADSISSSIVLMFLQLPSPLVLTVDASLNGTVTSYTANASSNSKNTSASFNPTISSLSEKLLSVTSAVSSMKNNLK